jgi:DNA-binding response OmpR family regulator
LAEDNADMREYIGRLLRSRYDVQAVADGAQALVMARREPPDLVLTDAMMPRLDGLGLLRALRADETTRAIPVVMLSARAGEESRIEGMEAGADDYLVKPVSCSPASALTSNSHDSVENRQIENASFVLRRRKRMPRSDGCWRKPTVGIKNCGTSRNNSSSRPNWPVLVN